VALSSPVNNVVPPPAWTPFMIADNASNYI